MILNLDEDCMKTRLTITRRVKHRTQIEECGASTSLCNRTCEFHSYAAFQLTNVDGRERESDEHKSKVNHQNNTKDKMIIVLTNFIQFVLKTSTSFLQVVYVQV